MPAASPHPGQLSEAPVDPEHPWLGLRPFTEETQRYFFGRTDEVREMFLLVREHALTVLFGQSGLGKTSLLRAGLIPKLSVENFRSVRVRLDFANGAPALVSQVRGAIAATVQNEGIDAAGWLERWRPLATLWEVFASLDARPPLLDAVPLVLIFDQFEEVFTLSAAGTATSAATSRRDEVRELFHQLADVIEHRPPIALQERFRTSRDEARRYDFRPAAVRVVLSLREDYLSHLETWKPVLPSLMRNRLPLRLLSGPQALEAVIGPGQIPTPPLVSNEVGAAIVRHVARQPAEVPIEQIEAVPPLISLLCERLNAARLESQPPQDHISAGLVAVQSSDILQRFYDQSFDAFDEATRSTIRAFVEDELLTSTGGHRKPVPREDAVAALDRRGVPDPDMVIDALLVRRLLTSEYRGNLPCIEITHDVLAPLVLRSREARQKALAEQRARSARLEAEARTTDDRRQQYRADLYNRRFVRSLTDERFWSVLFDEIMAGSVRPVFGTQALTIAPDDRLLLMHAAAQLAVELGLPPELVPPNPTLKQVAAVAALKNEAAADVHVALRRILDDPALTPGTVVRTLARVPFPLYLTATPDWLLESALQAAGRSVQAAAFHPRQPEDVRFGADTSVYHLFGIARNFPSCVISADDALEYAIGFSRHLSDLRRLQQEVLRSSLLIVGLDLSDWLARVFLRIALGARFEGGVDGGWLADLLSLSELAETPRESFPNSTVLYARQREGIWAIPADPVQFALEFAARWEQRQAVPARQAAAAPPQHEDRERKVFISYASEDRQAASELKQRLEAAGVPVWLDLEQLRPGDEWVEATYRRIQACRLFIAVISRNSESREYAMVHRERAWAAEQQERMISGRVFYLPIIIDDLEPYEVRHEFLSAQMKVALHAPGGHLPAEALAQVRRLADEGEVK